MISPKREDKFTTASLIIIGLGIISIGEFQEIDRDMDKKKLNMAIEQEYSVYIDGQEVDIDKIDLSLYETNVSMEDKVVYATSR